MISMAAKLILKGGIIFRFFHVIIFYLAWSAAIFADDSINIDQNRLNEDPEVVKNILMKPIISIPKKLNQNTIIKKDSSHSESLLKEPKWILQKSHVSNHDEITKPNEVKMFPNRAPTNAETIQTTAIKLEKPLTRDMPFNAIYQLNGHNYMSESGINAIISPVKMTSFIPEPGSINFQWINDNHGIAFQMKGQRKTLQAIVTFENQNTPISLFFDIANVPGRVISLPHSLIGIPLPKLSKSNKKKDSYDDEYINSLMNNIINGKSLGSAWQYQESEAVKNPYNEIAVKRYQHWFNHVYSIKKFELCSQSDKAVSLNEKTFATADTIAVVITKHRLKPNDCSHLIVMSRSDFSDSQLTDMYAPSQG